MYLETERLVIRDFLPEDVADLQEILGDEETMKYSEPAYALEKTEEFLWNFCIGRKGAVAAVQKEKQKVIGYLLFNETEEKVREMGWFFNRNCWRQGYAYEACHALMEYAFSEMGVHRIFAETIDVERSVQLMEKLGMRLEGIQREQLKDCRGRWADLYFYGMLEAEWAARKVIDHYDSLIAENNDPFQDAPSLREYMSKWDGSPFVDAMKLSKEKSVLEVGIGTGRVAGMVAPHCGKLTGIDISPKTVERAKENLAEHENATLICADFLTYDFEETYDVVYSTLTSMHFEDKQVFIAKAAALLQEGGIFCLSIEKEQKQWIDMGSRRLRIYPDDPKRIRSCMNAAKMRVMDEFETEFARVFVCMK